MHGRLKVKTTAEQEEAKRKEREVKAKKYTAATQRIFEKRKLGEKDQECIDLTGKVLGSNPDFYSLWNIRRETLQDWQNNRQEDEMKTVYENELGFLEQCLRINPKSYGTWHHRCWVMDNMPDPNWKKELSLCNKYLEYDERNFHCWDYRRFIVKRSNVSPDAEFQFTIDKINSNFSNYSSWHYRSKLLPLIHPDPSHPVGVQESVLLQEFELAQNAFFTDPNDQSAWFYHRWLLGRGERKLQIEIAVVDRECSRCLLLLNKEPKEKNLSVHLEIDQEVIKVVPKPVGPSAYSKIWELTVENNFLSADCDHTVSLQLDDKECIIDMKICKDEKDVIWRQEYKKGNKYNYELSAATSDTLTQELESCEQLHELEPDNKWTLLTIVLLMRAIDPLKYEKETFEYILKLKQVDSTRQQYYNDLRSKFIIENAIEMLPNTSRSLDLSGQGLTSLFHTDHMAHLESIDLSNNQLGELNELYYLQCLKTLKIENNPINFDKTYFQSLPKLIF